MQKKVLKSFFKRLKGERFTVTFWDGETETYGIKDSKSKDKKATLFHLFIREKLNLTEIMTNPQVKLGEAYMEGKIDFEGDLQDVFHLAIKNQSNLKEAESESLINKFWNWQKNASRKEQEKGVQDHYDLGNDFFRLWLDETMIYSCAYFRSKNDSLKKAQLQKIDHTLKKLNLKEGEKLLDIGCGWGWLIIRAVKQYNVQALGITLSQEQFEETKKRIKEEGLEDKVEVRLIDYRELAEEEPVFDKIVSVGMFEHVGKEHFSEYFTAVNNMLQKGGLSLLHTLTHPTETPTNPWLQKYIFPWGYIPSLREVVWELPEYSFHLLDAESLRMHYAYTTEHWAENFEEVTDQVKKMYDEKFVRMWRLFLVGCTVSFRHTGLGVHQLLFSKGLNNNHPLTREYLYENLD